MSSPIPFFEACVGYGAMTDASTGDLLTKGGWSLDSPGLTYVTTDGPFGLGSFRFNANFGRLKHGISELAGRPIVSFRYRPDTILSLPIMRLWNGSGIDGVFRLRLTPAGALQAIDANDAVAGTTAAGLITPNEWHHIVCDVEVGSTSGLIKIWVNKANASDTPDLSLTGKDLRITATGSLDMISFGHEFGVSSGGPLNSGVVKYAEITVLDSDGPAGANAFLGDKRFYALSPTGAGVTTTWTPNAGSNFDRVDDPATGASDDTTYNEGAAQVGADLFVTGDLPVGVVGIVFVGVVVDAKKTDGGDSGDMFIRAHDGTVTGVNSDELDLTTAYRHYLWGFVDVPGGSGWTRSQVNAAQFGYTQPAV